MNDKIEITAKDEKPAEEFRKVERVYTYINGEVKAMTPEELAELISKELLPRFTIEVYS